MFVQSFIAAASALSVVGVAGAWQTATTPQALAATQARTETSALKVAKTIADGSDYKADVESKEDQ